MHKSININLSLRIDLILDNSEGEKVLVINNAQFEISAVKPQQYPAGNLPEVAFAGRSNVGKSSIINSLLNRKAIARVSSTPGKTREINFYNLDKKLYFVDLPGYGYAKVSKDKKQSWGDVISTYLDTRQNLALTIMLVDIRHLPSADDCMMFDWIKSSNIPYLLVASKADKITRSQVNPSLQAIRKALGLDDTGEVIPYSAETKQGRDEIWRRIDSIFGTEQGK